MVVMTGQAFTYVVLFLQYMCEMVAMEYQFALLRPSRVATAIVCTALDCFSKPFAVSS